MLSVHELHRLAGSITAEAFEQQRGDTRFCYLRTRTLHQKLTTGRFHAEKAP